MGVKDLLKKALCKYVQKRVSLKSLVAQGLTRTVVDTSSFIHEASTVIAADTIADNRTAAIAGCNSIFKARINTLGQAGVQRVHFVFDGAPLPSKLMTNNQREKERAAARKSAELFKAGMSSKPRAAEKQQYANLCRAGFSREQW